MPKTKEQKKKEIEEGEVEEDIYSEEGREEMFDEDEITDLDEGFMKGYEEGAKAAKCPVCGEVVEYDFVEREIDEDVYRFCSDEHADLYMKKIEKKRAHRRV